MQIRSSNAQTDISKQQPTKTQTQQRKLAGLAQFIYIYLQYLKNARQYKPTLFRWGLVGVFLEDAQIYSEILITHTLHRVHHSEDVVVFSLLEYNSHANSFLDSKRHLFSPPPTRHWRKASSKAMT